jgi:hypothetical protein
MKSKLILIGAAVLLAVVASAWAADVAGKWSATQTGRDGQPTETTWVFKVEGTKLTGTMTNAQGEIAISDGKIEGDEISFATTRKMNFGGNETEIKTTWKGKVSGDEIKFTREFPGMGGGAGRMGGGPGGGAGGPGGGFGGPGGAAAGAPPAGGPGGGGGMMGGPGGGAGGPGGGMMGGARGGGMNREIIAKRVK